MSNYKEIYRVRASVYPTPHNKIWLSSGRVPLYDYHNPMNLINLSVNDFIRKFGGEDGRDM